MSPLQRGRLWLAVSTVGWALLTPTSKFAMNSGFLPLSLLAVQLATAAAALGAVVWHRGRQALPPLRHSLLRALLEPVGNVGLCWLGLAYLSAARSSLLYSVEGLLTAVLAAVVLRERLSAAAWCGLLAGVPGLWLLMGASTGLSMTAGSMLVLAGVTCSAIYGIVTARVMRRDVDAITTSAVQMTLALVVVAPLALGGELFGSHSVPDLPAWGAAIGGGLLLAGPSLLYTAALAHVPVGESGLIYNAIPVIGAGLGVLLLGEALSLAQLVGGVLVLAGVLLVTTHKETGSKPRTRDDLDALGPPTRYANVGRPGSITESDPE
ncbi:DMT family transporter [Nonomuraea sp. SYSU D8015]|uniref:DMT family transporter n=1 Tax=Nonomuraea sp. SYSU D8015 TaxID=2593644 RepID=UPI0016603815|nr:DMT family transporter [Nonomuraea sp. SYSU D8015]